MTFVAQSQPSQSALIVSGTPAYRKLALALLIAGLTPFAMLYSVQALLPILSRTFRVSAAEASLVVSLATGAMAVTMLLASVISDRIGRRQIMAISLYAASVITILSAIVPGWPALLITRLLTGIALAGIPSIAMSYVAEEVAPSSMGGAVGLYIGGSAIGGMLGRILAGIITDWLGWRYAVGSIGAVSLLGAAVFWRVAPASQSFTQRRHDWKSFAASVRQLSKDAA